ncbi:STAS domain-containing protein [Arthrobacter sp. NEB 688]|uniref:STAS domain-containing protein n=1 Tax=Arthrobacter sp. NEB 688 TaxID=904039 RepID=UPI001563890A|nr:STAS domain-containing protein [Arthrobacter sp. NEB 688]QKE84101.1 STAS domain-containing protein [Arthrobacter sp. NEB 688]
MDERGAPAASIVEQARGDGVLVTVTGRLDARSAADLRGVLHRVIAQGADPIHLDLTEAHIGDACALGLLLEVHRRAHRAGRHLAVVAADDRTRRLLLRLRLPGLLALPVAAR